MLAFEKDLLEKINKTQDRQIKELKEVARILQEINQEIKKLNEPLEVNEMRNEVENENNI